MNKTTTRVFLTGATGVMGSAGLDELIANSDKYEITVLARDSKRNRKKLAPYMAKGVKVIFGDLLDEESLRKGIEDADIILHVGGMVSPMAEHYPEKTLRVNVGSMKLIASIVKEIETKNQSRTIKTVFIGSVSQYGSKMPPRHWGEAGQKLESAKFDAYAVSKILAERALVEAGLKKWVSLRQTAILHPGLLTKVSDPVAFHVPVNGVLEWVTREDSGRLLERVCRPEVPENFWCQFYNVGGGKEFRLTNLEFERGILKGMGCPPPEKIFDPSWFAGDNFHGIWFVDSDYLDLILKFRKPDSFEEAISRMKKELPAYFKLAPLAPAFIIKAFMKNVACKEGLGPLSWIKENHQERIEAAWGCKENHDKIPGWDKFEIPKLPKTIDITLKCKLPPDTNLEKTVCSRGHEYLTSPSLEAGGHGCPHCLFVDSKVEEVDL